MLVDYYKGGNLCTNTDKKQYTLQNLKRIATDEKMTIKELMGRIKDKAIQFFERDGNNFKKSMSRCIWKKRKRNQMRRMNV